MQKHQTIEYKVLNKTKLSKKKQSRLSLKRQGAEKNILNLKTFKSSLKKINQHLHLQRQWKLFTEQEKYVSAMRQLSWQSLSRHKLRQMKNFF